MSSPLDIEQPGALISYLRETGDIAPDEQPRIEVLAGGVSNRTVLVERANGQSWVVKQALAKLRVSVDWFSDPARIGREALGLNYLAQIAPPGSITPLVFEDPGLHLLAMQAVPRPHENWKTILLAGRIEHDHVEQFGRLLGTIHRAGWERRSELAQVFADRSFFESLRIEPYYLYTARQIPEAAPFLKELVLETRLRQLTLVHGDYSPKNILIASGKLILLDHEVIHFGDPAFDLGFSLTHFLSKGHYLAAHRAAFADAARQYWRAYQQALNHSWQSRAQSTPGQSEGSDSDRSAAPDSSSNQRTSNVRWQTDLEEFAIRHTLGCLLARVAGRSPLEYLTPAQRQWQQASVLTMMHDLPGTVDELIETFLIRE
jgi:tRNA A-37 threonylcarbamoyl transferase component Bud32